jgi:hypothetical protein
LFEPYSWESETGDEKDVIKTVQKCLNKTIANRTITKQETICQIGKLPLIICSEQINIISLSKAVRVTENTTPYSTIFVSKYANRTDHLDKSLHQYFHIIKNNSFDKHKKEFIPHYVGGGGQPSYQRSINFARTEMMKQIPWHKNNSLPTITEENCIDLFSKFRASSFCPTSVSISIKRAENHTKNYRKGLKEPISEEIIDSQPIENNIDPDTQDLIKTTTNLRDTIDIFQKQEQEGLDIRKHYKWDKRIYKVSFLFIIYSIFKYTKYNSF